MNLRPRAALPVLMMTIRNFFSLWLLTSLLAAATPALAGPCDAVLQRWQTDENAVLAELAPVFQQGREDGTIQLELRALADCATELRLQLPAADLEQTRQYLEQNPAKRILMSAQGYAIPEQTESVVTIAANDTHPAELKALNQGLEFMYQLLTQLRAHIPADQQNQQDWPLAQQQSQLHVCRQAWQAADLTSACQCRLAQLSARISPRQMALITYLQQQPYATATGALSSFNTLNQSILHSCQLQPR
jgi:hypothetical protein